MSRNRNRRVADRRRRWRWITFGAATAGVLITLLVVLSLSGGPAETLRVGEPAPAFTLNNSQGEPVGLEQLLAGHDSLVLVFYRGYF